MKRISFLLACLFTTALYFTSCEPGGTDTPITTDPREAFVGNWFLNESAPVPALATKSINAQSYSVIIKNDPSNSSQVLIGNFGNSGDVNITAKGIVTSGQITLPKQSLSNGWSIESGTVKLLNTDKTKTSWTFIMISGGDKESYTATGTKQ